MGGQSFKEYGWFSALPEGERESLRAEAGFASALYQYLVSLERLLGTAAKNGWFTDKGIEETRVLLAAPRGLPGLGADSPLGPGPAVARKWWDWLVVRLGRVLETAALHEPDVRSWRTTYWVSKQSVRYFLARVKKVREEFLAVAPWVYGATALPWREELSAPGDPREIERAQAEKNTSDRESTLARVMFLALYRASGLLRANPGGYVKKSVLDGLALAFGAVTLPTSGVSQGARAVTLAGEFSGVLKKGREFVKGLAARKTRNPRTGREEWTMDPAGRSALLVEVDALMAEIAAAYPGSVRARNGVVLAGVDAERAWERYEDTGGGYDASLHTYHVTRPDGKVFEVKARSSKEAVEIAKGA